MKTTYKILVANTPEELEAKVNELRNKDKNVIWAILAPVVVYPNIYSKGLMFLQTLESFDNE